MYQRPSINQSINQSYTCFFQETECFLQGTRTEQLHHEWYNSPARYPLLHSACTIEHYSYFTYYYITCMSYFRCSDILTRVIVCLVFCFVLCLSQKVGLSLAIWLPKQFSLPFCRTVLHFYQMSHISQICLLFHIICILYNYISIANVLCSH